MPHREGERGGRRRFGTTMVMDQDGGGVGGPAEGAGGEDGVSHQPGPERMTAEMTGAVKCKK